MDPITRAFQFMAAVANAFSMFYDGASPAQKIELVQQWVETETFWREQLAKLKGTA